MEIDGLQKLTLLDYPEKLACTVFLSGCNLRCPFCHNASLVLPERTLPPVMTDRELLDFLKTRRGKLDGVCVTGGEPALRPELPKLLQEIRALDFLVKLDTNGTNPRMLKDLVRDGLVDYVAMDIKNSPERYRETCGGVDVLERVRESAAFLLEGYVDYEFRTTVVKPLHRMEDLQAIGIWLRGAKRYDLQQFVDSGDLIGTGLSAFTPEEMEQLRDAVLPYIPNTKLRGV